MAMLAQAAEYETLVTSDADARVSPDYLRRMVQELADPSASWRRAVCGTDDRRAGGATGRGGQERGDDGRDSGGRHDRGWDAVRAGSKHGAAADAFEKAGGYEDLGQYYAEDFVLGQRLAEAGFGVRMANYVVRLMVLHRACGRRSATSCDG